MRKYFEDLTLTGWVLLICPFVLGVFLRFYDLSTQSPWTDELATWFYVKNPNLIFSEESHSPFYYLFLRIFAFADPSIFSLRILNASISFIHLILFFVVGLRAFKENRFMIFWIIICLYPLDIIFARMARQYSWLLEGTILFYFLWKIKAPAWTLILQSFILSFLHVFALIPILVILAFDFLRNKNFRLLKIVGIPSLGILLYYLARFITFGGEWVSRNLNWNEQSFSSFFQTLMTQFFGNAYPRSEIFLFHPYLGIGLFVLTVLWLLYRKKNSTCMFLCAFLASLLFIEGLNPFINLRVDRYLVFLPAIWILAISESSGIYRPWKGHLTLGIMLGFLMIQNPIMQFPWDYENVTYYQNFVLKNPGIRKIVCLGAYQKGYYNLDMDEPCRLAQNPIDLNSPLIFFDLNGQDKALLGHLLSHMNAVDYIQAYPSVIVKFVPKK